MKQFGRLILSLPDGSDEEFMLEKPNITLGRSATNDVTLLDTNVSRTHARLEYSPNGCTINDLGSANGVIVNGLRVEHARLSPGDVIRLGECAIRFEIASSEPNVDAIAIDSEEELDATLAQATVPIRLNNTAGPRLVVHTPTKTWEVAFSEESLSIGRHISNDLVLDQDNVSRRHARIERTGDTFRIRDLGSTNGTWLRSRKIEDHTFQEGETVQIGNTSLVFKGAFGPDDLTLIDEPQRGERSPRQPVIFVPGMMGSELWRGSERLWPNARVMFTQPEIFRYRDGEPMEARGIVGEVVIVPNLVKQQRYGRLGDYLEEALTYERGRDLLEFAYDWRQDLRISAQRLAEEIELKAFKQPITVVAHSLGCMVSRYYIECLGGKAKVGRLILLGGPHAGYPRAISHLLSGPDLLPFGLLGEQMRQVIATFPSLYQILPASDYVSDQKGEAIDVLSEASWLAEEQRPLLADARAFRHELGSLSSVPTISIFGYGLKTITDIKVARNRAGKWQKAEYGQQDVGDTDIPESSAVLPGSEIHPVQQHHGSLYVDSDVKMRLKLELTRQFQA